MAEQRADLLEIVLLLQDLHRDAVPEVVRVELGIADHPAVHLAEPPYVVLRQNRVAVIRNPTTPGTLLYWNEMQAAAPVLKVTLQSVEVGKANDLDNAFAAIVHERAQALYVRVDALIYTHRSRLLDFARKRRLPMLATLRDFAEAGSLMSQAVHWGDLWRRAATYVDKILRGATPADLPVEQPTRSEFVVNLKTAKALGLSIPPSLLARADQLIE